MADNSKQQARREAQTGESYRLAHRYREAIERFDAALALDPDYAWAKAHRGAAYGGLGDLSKAADDLTQATIRPDGSKRIYPWAHAALGEIYRNAIYAALLGSPIEMMPDRPEHQEDTITHYLEVAYRAFQQAIEEQPDYFWAYAHLGATYRLEAFYMEMLDNPSPEAVRAVYEKALAALSQALAKNPSYAWALGYRSIVYKYLGEYRKGLEDLLQAVSLDPSIYDKTYLQFGMMYYFEGNSYESQGGQAMQELARQSWERALLEFEAGLTQWADDPDMLFAKTVTEFKLDHPNKWISLGQAKRAQVDQIYLGLYKLAALTVLEGENQASGGPPPEAYLQMAESLFDSHYPKRQVVRLGGSLEGPSLHGRLTTRVQAVAMRDVYHATGGIIKQPHDSAVGPANAPRRRPD